ncbi:MAG: SDR family NAD(P)-dependent oxidoreductase [Burkholderiales bacterium]
MTTTPVAMVTGGSAGIGKAICEHLLRQDYAVISLDRQPARINHTKFSSVTIDLFDAKATAAVVGEVCAKHAVTTIVHNAGVIRAALLPDVKLDDVNALMTLHVATAITLVQAALPAMKAAGFGRVVMVSSRAALGLATRTAYSASKAGMIGMARTWALELGPFGITVNVVAPGPILTDMFYDLIPADSPKINEIARNIPVKRIGAPDDVARAVMFLAAPLSGFVTGQVLYVCGGTSIGSITF